MGSSITTAASATSTAPNNHRHQPLRAPGALWRLDHKGLWDCDTVWRASLAHNAPTFPAMMPPVEEREAAATYRAIGHTGVWLPGREHYIANLAWGRRWSWTAGGAGGAVGVAYRTGANSGREWGEIAGLGRGGLGMCLCLGVHGWVDGGGLSPMLILLLLCRVPGS